MIKREHYAKPLLWFLALLTTALMAACGGGDQGRDAILGLPAADLVAVVVTPATATILTNGTQQFVATATFSDGTSRNVSTSSAWASSMITVATVNSTTGLAMGVTAGASTISASFGGKTGSAILTVRNDTLLSISVTPVNPSVAIGGMQQFVATATFSDGTSRNVSTSSTWVSSMTMVATVNSTTGLAMGVTAGTSTISASFGGKTGSTILTVTNDTLLSISVTPVNPSVAIGGMQQFIAMGTFSNGTTSVITPIATWTSATPAVATVNSTTGLATGVTAGTSVITASVGSIQGSTTLTVTAATLLSIAITPVNPSLAIGATQQLTVTASFSDNSTTNVTNMTSFTSATPAAVSVGATTGLTTGIASGSSLITGTFNGKIASTTVTVNTVTLSSISVTPPTATVAIAGTQAFVATGTFSDGSTAVITSSVTWSSGNILVATVLPSGVATGLIGGTSIITATLGVKTGAATLTVTPGLSLSSISVTPLNPSASVGSTQQFMATGTFSDASTADITNAVTWSSSLTNVATILPTGNATAIAVGVSNITATQGTKSGTTTFTVTAAAAGLNLGSATNFAVLAGTSITNNSGGTTLVTGDVGSPSQTVDPVQTAGFTNFKSGAVLTTALADLQVAITDANSRICDVNSAGGIDLGGQTFGPGVYCFAGAISITGTFTMNGPGLYIFRTASTLNTTANSIVALNGGATAGSVFWVPVGATTLGANSFFKGSILGQSGAITLGDNASLQNGRVLTGSAATLRNNVIAR